MVNNYSSQTKELPPLSIDCAACLARQDSYNAVKRSFDLTNTEE